MNKLWNRVRRLGTAIMLLAACAFAFHTGAVAADFGAVANYDHAGFAAHQHTDPVDAAHADGDHVHLADTGGNHADQKHGQCKVPCCGTGCTTAVLAFGIVPLEPARTLSVRVPLPPAVALSGADLKGLKRPPRPLPLG